MGDENIIKLNNVIERMAQNLEEVTLRLHQVESGENLTFNKQMENIVQKITNKESYLDFDVNNKFKGKLPEKFSTSDFPMFKPTNNPKYHLRKFNTTMIIKFVDPEFYPTVSPMSLDPAFQNCFYAMDSKHVEIWGDITRDFMKQFEYNTVIQT